MKTRALQILLVEDNPGDAILVREALRENKSEHMLDVVPDGAAALEYLQQRPPYSTAPKPDLVLLDLNLPKFNGFEVLQWIKSRDLWKHLPVLMLTSSNAAEDIAKSYGMYANCFINKPLEFGSFVDTLKSVERFWTETVSLPAARNSAAV
jgi:CheY-like chemotaxis protein